MRKPLTFAHHFERTSGETNLELTKKSMKTISLLSLVAIALLVVSCGKMPQESIDTVNASIKSARSAQADVYMGSELKAAQDSMVVIMQGIETENSKMFKSFDSYKTRLDNLKGTLDQIIAEVPAKKEAFKQEALAGLDNLKQLYAEGQDLLAKAPKGKEGKAVLQQIGEEFKVIESTIAGIETTLAGDANYIQVLAKENATQKSISDINTELSDAIAKKAGKK